MELALGVAAIALVVFLLRPRKASPLVNKYHDAGGYVISQLERGVPLEEAQRKARQLYGLD